MLSKKTICRMDIVSRKVVNRKELIRLSIQDGYLKYDPLQNMPGRGIYLLKNKETIDKAFRKGMFRKYASLADLDALYKELIELC